MTLCWTCSIGSAPCAARPRIAASCWTLSPVTTPADHASLRRSYRYGGRSRRKSGFRFGVVDGACDGISPEVEANFNASLDLLRGRSARSKPSSCRIFPMARSSPPSLPPKLMPPSTTSSQRAASRNSPHTAFRRPSHSPPPRFCPHMTISVPNASATSWPASSSISQQAMTRYSHPAWVSSPTGLHDDFELGLPRALGRRPLNLAGVLTGSPTISVINGFGEGGLPTGIQFAGAPFSENVILDAASALEWHDRLGIPSAAQFCGLRRLVSEQCEHSRIPACGAHAEPMSAARPPARSRVPRRCE